MRRLRCAGRDAPEGRNADAVKKVIGHTLLRRRLQRSRVAGASELDASDSASVPRFASDGIAPSGSAPPLHGGAVDDEKRVNNSVTIFWTAETSSRSVSTEFCSEAE